MTKVNLQENLRFNSEGLVDVDSTVESLRSVVERLAEDHNQQLQRVSDAVNEVFNQHPSAAIIPTNVIVFEAVKQLSPDVSTLTQTENLVRQYLKNNLAFKSLKGKGIQRQ